MPLADGGGDDQDAGAWHGPGMVCRASMGRLDDLIESTLSDGLPARVDLERIGEPQPAALWREGDRGAVLLLYRRKDRTVHALVAIASRTDEGWWIDGDGGFGWAPIEAVRVEGRHGEQTVTVDVGQAFGVYVLAFPGGVGPSSVVLSALDESGSELGTLTRELPY